MTSILTGAAAALAITASAMAIGGWMDHGPQRIAGPAIIVDGDTLRIERHRIRLAGIDAPELDQPCNMPWGQTRCGKDARRALAGLIHGRDVACEYSTTDRYGRKLAHCSVGDIDLGGWMVHQGWAICYRRYTHEYCQAESEARELRLGIWTGRFVEPEKWRHAR